MRPWPAWGRPDSRRCPPSIPTRTTAARPSRIQTDIAWC
jgi:hypothetical protein